MHTEVAGEHVRVARNELARVARAGFDGDEPPHCSAAHDHPVLDLHVRPDRGPAGVSQAPMAIAPAKAAQAAVQPPQARGPARRAPHARPPQLRRAGDGLVPQVRRIDAVQATESISKVTMTLTQQLLEALAAAAQVRSHGELRGAGAARDLAHGRIGVVVEDDGGALPVGQVRERGQQLGVDLGIEVRAVGDEIDARASAA